MVKGASEFRGRIRKGASKGPENDWRSRKARADTAVGGEEARNQSKHEGFLLAFAGTQ